MASDDSKQEMGIEKNNTKGVDKLVAGGGYWLLKTR